MIPFLTLSDIYPKESLVFLKAVWDKGFKSGLNKFSGRQPLKNLPSPLLNTLSHIFCS